MADFIKEVSHTIKNQFPDIYHEEGEDLIAFMEAFYEFVDEAHAENKDMFINDDIDTTLDEFLLHFKQKYLDGFPYITATDTRFLIKHIMEYYRSKGSEKSLRLLMRLLFGEEIEIYYPAVDIFKPSDSKWVEPVYLELSRSDKTINMINKRIVGSISKSNAFIESIVTKHVNGKIIDIAYLSDVDGDFVAGDIITTGGDLTGSPKVLGSLNKITMTDGGTGYAIGDILSVTNANAKDGIARVTAIDDVSNRIVFTLEEGGTGISKDFHTSITLEAQGTGSDASFEIGELENIETVSVVSDEISPYINTPLNGALGFPSNPTGTIANTINELLSTDTYDVGTIKTLVGINPGQDYNADITVSIINNSISTYNIRDEIIEYDLVSGSFRDGEIVEQSSPVSRSIVSAPEASRAIFRATSPATNFIVGGVITGAESGGVATITRISTDVNSDPMGANANITAVAQNIQGRIIDVDIEASGYGYRTGDILTLTNAENAFSAQGIATAATKGNAIGFWETTSSHISDTSVIRDNDFYQEYSYEIRANLSLDRYSEIIKDILHVAGTKMFGKFTSSGITNVQHDADFTIAQTNN